MGKDLHYSLLPFWEKALKKHEKVSDWEMVEEQGHYLYRVKRVPSFSNLIILVADEYRYIIDDYINRPDDIGTGSMIYLIKPQSGYDISIVDIAKSDQITIGKFGEILGALNFQNHWTWESPLKRDAREKDKKTII